MMNTKTVSERELFKLSPAERSKLLAEKYRQTHPEVFTNDTAPDRCVSPREPRPASLPEDICSRKSGNSLASALAYEKAKLSEQEMFRTLLDLFHAHPEGLTSKEVGRLLGISNPNHYSPRLSDLRIRHKLIYRTGELREGAYVLKLKEF